MNDAFVSKKAINSVSNLDFYRRLFLVVGKSVNTTPSIAVLVLDRNGSTGLISRDDV